MRRKHPFTASPSSTSSSVSKRGKSCDQLRGSLTSTSTKVPPAVMDFTDPLFWGPYLAERQWGTVREDYSFDCFNWDYLSHWEAINHAYSWGEDGLLGISDKYGMLCASLALWNYKDPVLKERLFGLNGIEGNHGEDVKELYYYLDNTPMHSYMRASYKYPHAEFPYYKIINHGLSVMDREQEIIETGVFDSGDFWDVEIEYAKPENSSIICCITVYNHSQQFAKLDVIPQFCFRNTWSQQVSNHSESRPVFQACGEKELDAIYNAGIFRINFHHGKNVKLNSLLFTNNNSVHQKHVPIHIIHESSRRKSSSSKEYHSHGKKDAFHRYIIKGDKDAVNSDNTGTKCCAWMTVLLEGKSQTSVYWQIYPADGVGEPTIQKLQHIIQKKKKEAEAFYDKIIPKTVSPEESNVCRQAIAGLLWSKQYYHYNMDMKTKDLYNIYPNYGDILRTVAGKKSIHWKNLNCHDILLVPDKWEFPWFAAWDLAFQCVQYCRLDMQFAKDQILLLLSDRYMHTNGQIPGCEFDLSDPNPPLTAWAVWSIYNKDNKQDKSFLKTAFNRLIFCFQWWSKMDPNCSNLYGNGFMGMDNISVFDRSKLPSDAAFLKQADCTGWMGNFCLMMLQISLELCSRDRSYTDMCLKFFKQFLSIAKAINQNTDEGGLWNEEDRFFYDVLHYHNTDSTEIRVRSWTGIVPLLACTSINLKDCPVLKTFLLKCDQSFTPFVCKLGDDEFFMTLVSYTKLKYMLNTIFSEDEFLSSFGIRSLSRVYKDQPYNFYVDGSLETLTYLPGESNSKLFGGNSNWRGPIWLCMNYLFVECLEKYSDLDKVFTLPLSIKYPTGAQSRSTFLEIAHDISKRIVNIFLPNKWGSRPVHGNEEIYADDPSFESLVLFYEYFDAETGRGCGASHQTGWTSVVLEFIEKLHKYNSKGRPSQINFNKNSRKLV